MTTTDAPQGLDKRGRALWDALARERALDGPAGVLAHEACRAVDRLDRLDAALRGKQRDWLVLAEEIEQLGASGVKVTVVIDGLLSEARQQQNALRQMLSTMGVAVPAEAMNNAGGDGVDDVSARRAARLAAAANM